MVGVCNRAAGFVAAVVAICASILSVTAPAKAQTVERWLCGDGVAVVAPTEAAARVVCTQAAKARAFLDGCGISGREDLSVHVTPSVSRLATLRKAGDYDPGLRRARVLPLTSYLRVAKPRLGSAVIPGAVLHASVAAHEIAHGIFYEHTRHLDLPETAHEYVAYVVQLSTLPPDVQADIAVGADQAPPVTSLFMFSFFMLRADPERFALAAYRHFHQAGNGCAFLHRVVAGNVHFPPPGD